MGGRRDISGRKDPALKTRIVPLLNKITAQLGGGILIGTAIPFLPFYMLQMNSVYIGRDRERETEGDTEKGRGQAIQETEVTIQLKNHI